MSETIIAFNNVSKYYPLYHHITGGIKHFLFNFPKSIRELRKARFEALHNISFQIPRGEAFGIIGQNGAGKSTMLGLIAGVIRPTHGTIDVKGRVSPLLQLGAGFHHDLTGRENIRLNGVLLGLTITEVMQKMDQIIEFSELGEFIDQPIRIYSSGMMAKLGFSIAAHLDPQILLIDETLAVGDGKFKKKCTEKMKEFRDSGVTFVLVSHSMKDIENVCEKALWLEDHRIRMLGDVREVADAYCDFHGHRKDHKKFTGK